jgi:hypothetical protein
MGGIASSNVREALTVRQSLTARCGGKAAKHTLEFELWTLGLPFDKFIDALLNL